MNIIIEGLLLGLGLTILIGPLFFALTQTGLQFGGKAGIVLGIGIWISDILVIWGTWVFLSKMKFVTTNEHFLFWSGLLAAVILFATGVSIFIKRKQILSEQFKPSKKEYLALFTRGFMINTINPFTFIFWFGVISSHIISKNTYLEILVLLSVIMLVIIVTDSLKVILAKSIRKKITSENISLFSKIAGFSLMIFAVVVLLRVLK